ncbi:MAG: hypothetical protein V4735_08170 [Pseudomonadota bacterium]
MTTRSLRGLLALAALLACSACANQTTTAFLNPHATPQLTALQWDQATAQQTMARVNNNGLIAMR